MHWKINWIQPSIKKKIQHNIIICEKAKLTKAVEEILTLKQKVAMMVDSVSISMAEELIALNINTCILYPHLQIIMPKQFFWAYLASSAPRHFQVKHLGVQKMNSYKECYVWIWSTANIGIENLGLDLLSILYFYLRFEINLFCSQMLDAKQDILFKKFAIKLRRLCNNIFNIKLRGLFTKHLEQMY